MSRVLDNRATEHLTSLLSDCDRIPQYEYSCGSAEVDGETVDVARIIVLADAHHRVEFVIHRGTDSLIDMVVHDI